MGQWMSRRRLSSDNTPDAISKRNTNSASQAVSMRCTLPKASPSVRQPNASPVIISLAERAREGARNGATCGAEGAPALPCPKRVMPSKLPSTST